MIKTNVGDMISRQAAIDAFIGEPPDLHYPSWYVEVLKGLPSAQPERKKGKWIPDEIAAYDMPKGEPRGWVPWLCSECGWCVGKHQTAFCPS